MDQRVGAHLLQIEGDVLYLTPHGDFTLADMKAFTAIAEKHAMPLGYQLILVDLAAAGTVPAEARRYSAEQVRAAKLHGPIYAATALFGGGPIARGVASLYLSALRILTSGAQTTHMVKTIDEARAILAERREYFRAQLKLAP